MLIDDVHRRGSLCALARLLATPSCSCVFLVATTQQQVHMRVHSSARSSGAQSSDYRHSPRMSGSRMQRCGQGSASNEARRGIRTLRTLARDFGTMRQTGGYLRATPSSADGTTYVYVPSTAGIQTVIRGNARVWSVVCISLFALAVRRRSPVHPRPAGVQLYTSARRLNRTPPRIPGAGRFD